MVDCWNTENSSVLNTDLTSFKNVENIKLELNMNELIFNLLTQEEAHKSDSKLSGLI